MKHTVAALLNRPDLELNRHEHQQNLADQAEQKFQRSMDLWVRFMRSPDSRMFFPPKAAVFGKSNTNYAAGEDDSELCHDMNDAKIGEVVDACVRSLEPHESAAVHRRYGLARVFRFPRMEYAQSLASGMAKLRVLIERRL